MWCAPIAAGADNAGSRQARHGNCIRASVTTAAERRTITGMCEALHSSQRPQQPDTVRGGPYQAQTLVKYRQALGDKSGLAASQPIIITPCTYVARPAVCACRSLLSQLL
jgi:hypothetical protein